MAIRTTNGEARESGPKRAAFGQPRKDYFGAGDELGVAVASPDFFIFLPPLW
jgi:hypothetical protein